MENPQKNTHLNSSFQPTIASLERGKIPPHDLRLEETVLGGMLIDKKGVDDAIDILNEEMFYRPAHQLIYRAINELFKKVHPIDIITVAEQLKKEGNLEAVGGEFYLIQLTQQVTSSAHIEFHARIIQQKHIQRSLIKISNEVIEEAYDETTDVFDLLDSAENKLFQVTEGNLKRSAESAGDLLIKALKKIQDNSNKTDDYSGIPSGFNKIDEITGGWQDTDLIILAARPAMGKTAFTLGMARNIAVDAKAPVAFFSLEMSSIQLMTRLISAETGIKSDKLRSGKLSDDEWKVLSERTRTLQEAPLFIDDTPALSIFDLRAKARRLVSQHGVKMIFIDYLQLMTAGGNGNKGVGNREQEISTISRNLKALAKELNIPVIALSQLSRAVESQPQHKRPQLSHLRESGAIEQDADIVTFLYRPEYYKLDEWDDDEKTPTKDQAEFIIAKHRNGGLDNIKLSFKDGVFRNLTNYWESDVSFAPVDFQPQVFESKMNNNDYKPSPNEAFDTHNGVPF